MSITKIHEYYRSKSNVYDEITLIDCNDSFTHNLVGEFINLGASVSVFQSHEIDFDMIIDNIGGYLVISPGPGKPVDSGIAREIYNVMKGKLPTFGVCLGMQLINEYYGGKTVKANELKHGKISYISHDKKGIFTNIIDPTPVARYHSLMIKPSSDVKIISEYQNIIMAISIKKHNTVGTQFHPESFMTKHGSKMIENFLEKLI